VPLYDVSSAPTFQSVTRWLQDLRRKPGSKIVAMLVGNKCDLGERMAVATDEGARFAKAENLLFIETSCVDAKNVEGAFKRLLAEIVHKLLASSELELEFGRKSYRVPKRFIVDFLERRSLFAATSYPVQSSVPVEVFEAFVSSLQTQRTVSATKENARHLSALASEFCLSDLMSQCSVHLGWLLSECQEVVAVILEAFAALEGQIQQSGSLEIGGPSISSMQSGQHCPDYRRAGQKSPNDPRAGENSSHPAS
jgi:hypothetical protein